MKRWLILILCACFAMLITACTSLNNSSKADISQETEYHGLTKDEYEDLQAQKARYEAMTDEQKQIAREGGTVGCKKFIHLWWEESISIEMINYVGSDRFSEWINKNRDSGDCLGIYSFADEFGLDLNTLKTIITENHLEEFYPLDRLETRFTTCQRKSITSQDFVQELADSVTFDSQAGNISFTIPNEIPDNYTIYLHVSGRSKMGDGSMSFHAFEEESENNSWKLGETYNYKIGKDALLEGIVDVGLVQNDNKELQYNQLVTIDENGTILFE